MPSPFLRSTRGPHRDEFHCSLCKTKFKAVIPSPPPSALIRKDRGVLPELTKEWETKIMDAKMAVQKEWDKHLRDVHPRQWEREERKRARRRKAAKPLHVPEPWRH